MTQPTEPDVTRGFTLRETIGYLVFRAVDIGDNSRDAALRVADDILAAVAAHDPDDLNHDGHGNPVPVPQPGVFHGSMDPPAMTGAEALDAARTGEEWAAAAGNIIGAYAKLAQASRDEADREDAEHVVRISFNSGKFLVKCEAGDLFDVAETLDAANETRAAHEGGES